MAIKLKINRLLALISGETDYQTFLSVNNMTIAGLNKLNADNMDCSEDEVCKVHISTWRKMISGGNSNDVVLITLKEYMEILKLKDKGFVYEILETTTNGMTPTKD